ncbi:G-protein coupled receptor Mth2 [Holothuria leucospilota]|uniref:G-protein coupled receptor Mth2 n=1 Tax=Holothuria leucospilota TaxID=206669 RepID=A0A9Q1H464_HOLLE|nr:G-protein coupled receptor Mth2 [Holothuria leucospilota]
MINNCPKDTEGSIKEWCTEEVNVDNYVLAEKFLPIKDENDILYKNVYCARCNVVDLTKSTVLQATHDCLVCPSPLSLLPQYKVKLSAENCKVKANFSWEESRSCTVGLVDNCPSDFEDTDVIELCRRYISPIITNATWFRNPHCALCNGIHSPQAYACAFPPSERGEGTSSQDDLFGNIWGLLRPLFFPSSTPELKETTGEIQKLSHCIEAFPQNMFLLAVTVPEYQLLNDLCPYFGKRLESCIEWIMQQMTAYNASLPWKQLIELPDTEPFPANSTLYFRIPETLTSVRNREQLVEEVYRALFLSEEKCGFGDMYLLRLCGNISSVQQLNDCHNLEEFNSTEIFIREKDSKKTFLHPRTLEDMNDVSWYAFLSKLSRVEIEVYKTKICEKQPVFNITTEAKNYSRGEHRSTLTPPTTSGRRFTAVEQIFSNTCMLVSITCLTFTFLTYSLFSTLRNSFGITLMNFVAAVATGHVLSHFVNDNVTQWRFVCQLVAILSHFVWLVAFAWMNLLAWHLKSTFDHKTLRSVSTFSTKQVVAYLCYGWIVPLFIVGVCCVLHFFFEEIPLTYGVVNGVTCWIGNDIASLSVVGVPLALAVLINGVLFALIVNGIRRSRFRPEKYAERSQHGRQKTVELLIYIKISLLMGFSWLLGFFISLDPSRVIWYTYYLLHAIQGTLVMAFFCFNFRVRSMWVSKLCRSEKNTTTVRSKETSL